MGQLLVAPAESSQLLVSAILQCLDYTRVYLRGQLSAQEGCGIEDIVIDPRVAIIEVHDNLLHVDEVITHVVDVWLLENLLRGRSIQLFQIFDRFLELFDGL